MDIKQLFAFAVANGVGRPVDESGFSIEPWTSESLTTALAELDPPNSEFDHRTVQFWFQNNDRGISPKAQHWLAHIFGCGDPLAIKAWQVKLSEAQRLFRDRRAHTKTDTVSRPESPRHEEAPTPSLSRYNTGLAVKTENLFIGGQSYFLPFAIFGGGLTLCLIAFSLNLHSVTIPLESGHQKQVGFLWAPNWTLVFIVLIPSYLVSLSGLLRQWQVVSHGNLKDRLPATMPNLHWNSSLRDSSFLFWVILFLTVGLASTYNWLVSTLLPLLQLSSTHRPVDWSLAALHPSVAHPINAPIALSALAFSLNAFVSYLFYAGMVFIYLVASDFKNLVQRLQDPSEEALSQLSSQVRLVSTGIFRCCALGIAITLAMKVQALYLETDAPDIVTWIATDIHAITYIRQTSDLPYSLSYTTPGLYYSFFALLPILLTYAVTLYLIAQATFTGAPALNRHSPRHLFTLHTAIIIALTLSYFCLGTMKGGSAMALISIVLFILTFLVTKSNRAASS